MHTVFWFEKHFQKGIRHGPSKKIDVYQANSQIFQHSLVDINFLARTVCYTFLELFFEPE